MPVNSWPIKSQYNKPDLDSRLAYSRPRPRPRLAYPRPRPRPSHASIKTAILPLQVVRFYFLRQQTFETTHQRSPAFWNFKIAVTGHSIDKGMWHRDDHHELLDVLQFVFYGDILTLPVHIQKPRLDQKPISPRKYQVLSKVKLV